MEINKKNIKVAMEIAEVLENEKCTVDETREILTFMIHTSGKKSTVQMKDVISELSDEFQKADHPGSH